MTRREGDMSIFPQAPLPCRVLLHRKIRIEKHVGVSVNKPVASQPLRYSGNKSVPFARKDPADPFRDPLDLSPGRRTDECQDERADTAGMLLRVSKAQCGSPGDAKNRPAVDVVKLPQRFDIGDEVVGRVGAQIGVGVAWQRTAAPGVSLVEEDGLIRIGVEVAASARRESGTGTAVKIHSRNAGRVAAALPVDRMPVADSQHSAVIRLDLREAIHDGYRRTASLIGFSTSMPAKSITIELPSTVTRRAPVAPCGT